VLGAPPAAQLPVNFPELLPHFTAGELVLIDDGAVALRVVAVTPPTVTLEVLNDGTIESRKGVNLPDTRLPIGALTANDRELLAWGLR
jgi:pyruvate kinase